MATGIMALLAKPKGGGPKGPPLGGGDDPASGGSPALNAKAAALKSMWDNMKSGDFEAAAMDFHDAYMDCMKAEDAESGGRESYPDLGGGEDEELGEE